MRHRIKMDKIYKDGGRNRRGVLLVLLLEIKSKRMRLFVGFSYIVSQLSF